MKKKGIANSFAVHKSLLQQLKKLDEKVTGFENIELHFQESKERKKEPHTESAKKRPRNSFRELILPLSVTCCGSPIVFPLNKTENRQKTEN